MTYARQLRVVVADDHYLLREGLRALLVDTGEVVVCATVGSAPELLAEVDEHQPDAVITDIRMPEGTEGIEAAHAIRARHPGTGVIVLSQHADGAYAEALLAHGTDGLAYLLKERVGDIAELMRALTEVCAGRIALDTRIVDTLNPGGTPPRRAGSTHSPRVSATCCARWRADWPTQASPRRCTCQSRRWKSTSGGSSPSSGTTNSRTPTCEWPPYWRTWASLWVVEPRPFAHISTETT